MATFSWEDDKLLCMTSESGEQLYKWTYSTFERFLEESITPSMYNYMATYVMTHMPEEMMASFESFDPYYLEVEAVDSYFDQPINDRIDMHEQELADLEKQRQDLEIRKYAAEQTDMFDPTSPIWNESRDFIAGLVQKFTRQLESVERQIFEEEQWRGGHEFGAEDFAHPMDID